MKSILIPTDFSDCADVATRFAIDLASRNEARVHFLHVINSGIDWINLPKEMESNHPDILKEIGEAEAKLTQLMTRARQKGVASTKSIAHNQSAEDIGGHLQDHQFDFLVMGSYGAKGIKKVIGSNTQKVLRLAEVPSIIVKENLDIENLKRIVFASNFEEVYPDSIKLIKELSEILTISVELLYVNTPDDFIPSDVINDRFRRVKNENRLEAEHSTIDSMSIEEGISKYCQPGDLVFVEYHKRSSIRRFFDPSITESLINYTKQSVVCFSVEE